jgi:hypothetical protein
LLVQKRAGPKGFGLFAEQDIKAGQFLIEYIGEVLEEEEYMRRKEYYIEIGQRHYYFMNVGNGEVIDACRKVRLVFGEGVQRGRGGNTNVQQQKGSTCRFLQGGTLHRGWRTCSCCGKQCTYKQMCASCIIVARLPVQLFSRIGAGWNCLGGFGIQQHVGEGLGRNKLQNYLH